MPKSNAPFLAPPGKKWCSRHNNNNGSFLILKAFPEPKYRYCLQCKREYQRKWDREQRKRVPRPVVPSARLSANEVRIIVHVPNTEKGRNLVRQLLGHYTNSSHSL